MAPRKAKTDRSKRIGKGRSVARNESGDSPNPGSLFGTTQRQRTQSGVPTNPDPSDLDYSKAAAGRFGQYRAQVAEENALPSRRSGPSGVITEAEANPFPYDFTQTDGLHSVNSLNGGFIGADELVAHLSEWNAAAGANSHGLAMFSFNLGVDAAGKVVASAILTLHSHVHAVAPAIGSGTSDAYINSANHSTYATTMADISRANKTDDTGATPVTFPSALDTLVDFDVTTLVNTQIAVPGFAGWICIGIELDYAPGTDGRNVGMVQLDGTTTNPAPRLVVTQ